MALGKVDNPPREQPLLQHPRPLQQRPLIHILVKVTWTSRRILLFLLHHRCVSWAEKAISPATGRAGSNGAEGGGKDILHLTSLGLEVTFWTLDDADGVDPEVLLPQQPRNPDRILKRLGQFIKVKPAQPPLNILRRGTILLGLVFRGRAPTVRENHIILSPQEALFETQLGRIRAADEDEALRVEVLLPVQWLALGVAFIALRRPQSEEEVVEGADVWVSRQSCEGSFVVLDEGVLFC